MIDKTVIIKFSIKVTVIRMLYLRMHKVDTMTSTIIFSGEWIKQTLQAY